MRRIGWGGMRWKRGDRKEEIKEKKWKEEERRLSSGIVHSKVNIFSDLYVVCFYAGLWSKMHFFLWVPSNKSKSCSHWECPSLRYLSFYRASLNGLLVCGEGCQLWSLTAWVRREWARGFPCDLRVGAWWSPVVWSWITAVNQCLEKMSPRPGNHRSPLDPAHFPGFVSSFQFCELIQLLLIRHLC